MSELLRDAIRKESRILMEMELIDACDIIWTDEGYEAVPEHIVGLRKSVTGIKDIRRWWGLLSKLNKKQKNINNLNGVKYDG